MIKQERIWWGIFVVSLLGTVGSLYYGYFGDPFTNLRTGELFSTANALDPCTLCWYARILLYPMVLISVIGIWKKDARFVDYILPLALIGIALETYHYTLQKFLTAPIIACGGPVPCNEVQVEYFGFISIPLLGLFAFLLIAGFCVVAREQQKT